MSDRLAVMREGEIEQIGRPRDVYDSPASTYVADFLGLANLLPATVVRSGVVALDGTEIAVPTGGMTGGCTAFVRPERVRIVDAAASAPGATDGVIDEVVFVGATTHLRVRVGERTLQVVLANDGESWVPSPGTTVGVVVPADAVRLLAR